MIASTNQVCSLELSRKLSAIGVVADSAATWVFDTLNGRWDLSGMPITAIKIMVTIPSYTEM